jgi:hypothetical protein
MWESLVVNLGYRSSSLLGEEFLSAPIHSPLSGRLIGPSEGSLEAVEPFPGLAGAKSSKEECRLPSQSHRSAYWQGVIHYESHPAPPPITRRAVCTKVDTASGGKSTRSLRADSEHSPSPSRPTRRSGERPDHISPRQAFTSNQMARSRQ